MAWMLLNQCSELQAIRKFLGLEIKEVAQLVGYSERSWQYWELEERIPPTKVLLSLDVLVKFVLDVTNTDKQYRDLPYFVFYEDFEKSIKDPSLVKWRIWQRVVGLLRINRKCNRLLNKNESRIEDHEDLYDTFDVFFKRFDTR